MATRSYLAVQTPQGTYLKTGVHWDGDPKTRLPILTKHYNTQEKALSLVSGGYISSIGEICDTPFPSEKEIREMTLDERIEAFNKYTRYHKRDMGYRTDTTDAFEESDSGYNETLLGKFMRYGYIFENGSWTVVTHTI